MTLFQLLALLFGLWMMYEISIHAKKRLLSPLELGFWLSLWSLFVVIAVFPSLLLGLSQQLRFSRVFDMLVVGAFMVLSIMIFVSYFAHKEMKLRLNQLVQELAIKEAKKNNPTKKAKS